MNSYILNLVTNNFSIFSILLFVLGLAFFAFGLCCIFSNRLDDWFKRKFPASELDKKLISPQGRDFIRRYLSSIYFVFMGAVLIFFSVATYLYR